jgi:predicted nucleotide-binding protein (sugar kinase/HSP70/actin superfamily)
MSDAAYALAAAFRRCGLDSAVMDEPDGSTLNYGLKFTNGNECMPCFVTTGDIIKVIEKADFDAKNSAFFMPTSPGPCKFGQYNRLHELVLDNLGYNEVEFLVPSAKNSYTDFVGDKAGLFRRLAWQGCVSIDILEKALYRVRPYEINKGETEVIYKECRDLVVNAIEKEKDIYNTMKICAKKFENILRKDEERPLIGVVGEIFLRLNRFTNNFTIDKIESLGGEVSVVPTYKWVTFTTYQYAMNAFRNKKIKDIFLSFLVNYYQKKDELNIFKPFKKLLRNHKETSIRKILFYARKYLNIPIGGEAILTIGESIDFAKKGYSGVISIHPFHCMPGAIVQTISKKFREDLNNFPWINLWFDGQESTNLMLRLEAFIHQAKQWQEELNVASEAA